MLLYIMSLFFLIYTLLTFSWLTYSFLRTLDYSSKCAISVIYTFDKIAFAPCLIWISLKMCWTFTNKSVSLGTACRIQCTAMVSARIYAGFIVTLLVNLAVFIRFALILYAAFTRVSLMLIWTFACSYMVFYVAVCIPCTNHTGINTLPFISVAT